MSRQVFIPSWTGHRIWRIEPAHQPFAEHVRVVCDSLRTDKGEPVWQFVQRDLLVDVPAGARNTDPATSHEAANLDRDLSDKHRLVLQLLADHGPATDFDLSQLAARHGITILATSIGKRRHELTVIGYVTNSGRRRPTATGASAICWEITNAGRQLLVTGK